MLRPMPNIRWLLALITTVHTWLYDVSGGRIGHRARQFRFLMLEHVGRKSGRHYRVPLLYLADGERWVLVASNAGDRRHPAWWLNLRARPEAAIQVGTERATVKAREAAGEERARLWTRLVSDYRWYDDYQRRAGRQIPVVILERSG